MTFRAVLSGLSNTGWSLSASRLELNLPVRVQRERHEKVSNMVIRADGKS